VSCDDSCDAIQIEADLFVEVAAKDDLMACLDFGFHEVVHASAEVFARMLILFAVFLELQYLLLMGCGHAARTRVLGDLVSGGDRYAFVAPRLSASMVRMWQK
jgi:hypothetical protein